jgi:hypothetical protein
MVTDQVQSGAPLTMGLFYETAFHTKEKAIFTLQDEDRVIDGHTYISLYKLYMECEDLTEYDFASKYMESWKQWDRITKTNWFEPYISRWRTELELKIKARALKSIVETASKEGKSSFEAQKYLLAKGYIDKTTEPNRRGRPSKLEVERKLKEEAFLDADIQADLERISQNDATIQ